MRIAVLSDIHGNLPATETVVKDIESQGVDGIIVAGDTVSGPQPQETIDLLRSLRAWMIRGNGEDYLLAYDKGSAPEAWYVSDQWASMRWTYERLDGATLGFIASLPGQRVVSMDGTEPIRVVHGSPQSPTEFLFPDGDVETIAMYREVGLLAPDREPTRLEEVLAEVKEAVVVCGHSHVPWKQERNRWLVVNAGSVGAPNNGDVRAQYALLSWEGDRWEATHRAIGYDLGWIRAAYEESGYLVEGGVFARACLVGIETGQNVPGALVSHVSRLATEAGWEGHEVVPHDIWEQAIETFKWTAA